MNDCDISREFYMSDGYLTKPRFISYWHQINEVLRCGVDRVLEVGMGSELVAECLTKLGKSFVTLDINPALRPDVIGSLEGLPFASASFELVMACQVLEHIPFADLPAVLGELHRVASKQVLLSVPNCTRCYCLQVPIPGRGYLRRQFEFPASSRYLPDEHHHWEIGHAGVSRRQLVDLFVQTGFTVQTSYRVFEHPYYHFFVLGR